MGVLEPTNLLLLACALIYGLIGEPVDGAILLVFVAAISLLDALHQQRSNRALAELARLSAPKAHGRRAGVALELAADQLQLGDLLRLEEGDRIAADARVVKALGLWLDESLLTGESLPVEKSRPGSSVLAGSLVASGRGWRWPSGRTATWRCAAAWCFRCCCSPVAPWFGSTAIGAAGLAPPARPWGLDSGWLC